MLFFAFQSDDSSGSPVNRISYVDVPEPKHYNPYATPIVQKPTSFASLKRNSQTISPTVPFYSSVPVPVDMTSDEVNHRSVSQNSTMKRQYEIPWDLKKYSDSLTTLNCSGSDLTMGYFANGRFYDPTPRQAPAKTEPPPEVYAPASSYSDRSNPPILSTFSGGIPKTHSFSSTQSSADSKYVYSFFLCFCIMGGSRKFCQWGVLTFFSHYSYKSPSRSNWTPWVQLLLVGGLYQYVERNL